MRPMNKAVQWLNSAEGKAAHVQKRLGVSRGFMSNVRRGKQRMPIEWFPALFDLSGGRLTYEALVKSLIKARAEK